MQFIRFSGNDNGMKIIIVAGGCFDATPPIIARLNAADLCLAADRGAEHLAGLGIRPHAVIGDMDSVTPETRRMMEAQGCPFLLHPARKDQTDTELCITYALEKGATDITILGATGLRLDHTLANVLLLKQLDDLGIRARIMDSHNEICLVSRSLALNGEPGEILSLVPVSEKVTGVTLQGLEYPLKDAVLLMGTALGVSNRFKEPRAEIRIESGLLLVIRSRD